MKYNSSAIRYMVKYTDIKAWRFVRTSGNGVHEGSSHAEDRVCHMARAEDTKLCKKHGDIQTATFRQGMWLKATDAATAVTVFVVHDCKENQSCKAPSLPKCSKREGDTAPVAKSENLFYIRFYILWQYLLLNWNLLIDFVVLEYFWMLVIVSCWCPKNWTEKDEAH